MVQQLKAGLPVLIKILSSAAFLPGTLNIIKNRREFSSHLRSKCLKNQNHCKKVPWQKTVQDYFQEQVEF